MSVSASDLDTALTKLAANMGRLDQIVNANSGTDVTTDSGLVPSYAKLASLVTGLVPLENRAVQTKTTAYTVQNSDNGKPIVLNGDSLFQLSFGSPTGYDTVFSVKVFNTSLFRGKRVSLSDSSGSRTFILWPGDICEIFSVGLGIWYSRFGLSGPQLIGANSQTSGAVKLLIKPSTGDDSANDGLGADAPLAHINRARDIFYYLADMQGTTAIIELMQGEIARENVLFDRKGPKGQTQMYLQAANGGAILAYPGGAGIQTRDHGICTVRRAPGGSGTFRIVPLDGSNNPVNGGVGLYCTQQSVLDTEDGLELGSHPSGYPIEVDRGDLNVKANLTISGGSPSFLKMIGGRTNWQGGTTVTFQANTNYDALYGGFTDLDFNAELVMGAGITFAGGTHSGRKFWHRGGSRASLGGNTLPGAVAGFTDAATFATTYA